MREQVVHVECYSGYKADERPLRLHLIDGPREVVAIEDRWYSPGATYYRVLADDGGRYVLRHEEAQDVWTLAGYRAAKWSVSGLPVIHPESKASAIRASHGQTPRLLGEISVYAPDHTDQRRTTTHSATPRSGRRASHAARGYRMPTARRR